LEVDIRKKLRVKMIKTFMELSILAQLRKNAMSGYDIITLIREKYGVVVSSGTVYSRLYRMERDGLVEGKSDMRKRNYTLTEKGKKTIETILNAKEPILEDFTKNFAK